MSTQFHWTSGDQKLEASLPVECHQELIRLCRAAGDRETGGILVGRYSDDLKIAQLDEIVPAPKDTSSGRAWFHRGTQGLKKLLGRRWHQKPKLYYLGEWHYHPSTNVKPSLTDLAQMQQIAQEDRWKCPEPILLIMGRPLGTGNISVTVFPKGLPLNLSRSSPTAQSP